MNKTVYLRDDEVPLWEEAKALSGDKISPIIVAALRQFVAEAELQTKGYERIVVAFDDSEDNCLPKKKAFYGRWIIDPKQPEVIKDEDNVIYYGAVAETAKGNIVVTEREEFEGEERRYLFRVYPSLQAVGADIGFRYLVRAALAKRGIPVEELDI